MNKFIGTRLNSTPRGYTREVSTSCDINFSSPFWRIFKIRKPENQDLESEIKATTYLNIVAINVIVY